MINSDFNDMTAEAFFEWLRNALAHGDGRTIRPIHKLSRRGDQTVLAGFEIRGRESRDPKRILTLSLYHSDMQKIGALLADHFCQSMSGDAMCAMNEIGTSQIEEAA